MLKFLKYGQDVKERKVNALKYYLLYIMPKQKNEDIYYVAKDFSTIVYLVHIHEGKPYTYVIPKKYLKVVIIDDMKKYFITKSSKLDLVSCSNNQIDDFDLFVVKNIISKIK